jgi:hypothetical protein
VSAAEHIGTIHAAPPTIAPARGPKKALEVPVRPQNRNRVRSPAPAPRSIHPRPHRMKDRRRRTRQMRAGSTAAARLGRLRRAGAPRSQAAEQHDLRDVKERPPARDWGTRRWGCSALEHGWMNRARTIPRGVRARFGSSPQRSPGLADRAGVLIAPRSRRVSGEAKRRGAKLQTDWNERWNERFAN